MNTVRTTKARFAYLPHSRAIWAFILTTVLVVSATGSALASHPEVSLFGSDFEIDVDANLKVDDASPSIDWASVTETRKADAASGSGDDSFGQGTKEDTAVPTVVNGSIPPNKSDLLNFGVYAETNASGDRFLNLFWHRVQEPSGTTNMDFEFNQSSTLSGNGVTPVRTEGDLLVQYDLSQGGTNPVLFLSRWVTSGPASQCQASNSVPCWGTKTNLSAAGDAAGSINTSAILAADSDGLGDISPRTFGEAQLDFDALTGGASTCVSFGSAYLKSRSSDSFTAALKDFIAPATTNLSNCGTVIIHKETDPDEDPNTTVFGYTKAFTTDPASENTFTLMDDGSKSYNNVLFGSGYTVVEDVIPTGWDFQSLDCSASTGVTPSINGATVTFDIDSATDILDCTYTNRQRGTIIVQKVTEPSPDPTDTSFGFTAGGGLSPTSFSLKNGQMQTYSNVVPGSGYSVAETVPAGWDLISATCDDGSPVSNIDVSAGETVTCTFTDRQQKGAIQVHKTSIKDGSGLAGAVFSIAGQSKTTDANGFACVDDLPFGNYTVQETSAPSGYSADDTTAHTVTVDNNAKCSDSPFVGETLSFSDTPLSRITVSFESLAGPGVTTATIQCTGEASPNPLPEGTPKVLDNLVPGTYTCTVVVDP